jgi:hypothetical protein
LIRDAAPCEQSDIKHRRDVQHIIGGSRTQKLRGNLVVTQQDLDGAAIRGPRGFDSEGDTECP